MKQRPFRLDDALRSELEAVAYEAAWPAVSPQRRVRERDRVALVARGERHGARYVLGATGRAHRVDKERIGQ